MKYSGMILNFKALIYKERFDIKMMNLALQETFIKYLVYTSLFSIATRIKSIFSFLSYVLIATKLLLKNKGNAIF